MTKLIAHINCSPYIEDGVWHIHTGDDDYFAENHDSEEISFDSLDNLLSDLLDKGRIHSYYIERDGEPAPVIHDFSN